MKTLEVARIVGLVLGVAFLQARDGVSADYQTYPGPGLPRSQVAVINCERSNVLWTDHPSVTSVDGKSAMVASNPVQNAISTLLAKPPVLHDADSVELLPGHHTIVVHAIFGGSGIGYATIRKEVDVEAGKTYSAKVRYKLGREISHSPVRIHGQPLSTTFEADVWIEIAEKR